MKKIIFLILLFSVTSSAQILKLSEARGLFMSFGVGPRMPVFTFSDRFKIGSGFDVTLSYVDSEIIPVFFYINLGYQHHPGKQEFYAISDYSSISSSVIVLNSGIRLYLPPIIKNFVILMPVVEGGFALSNWSNFYQFKIDTNKPDINENITKAGFQVGAGFSMFLMDVMLTYNYFSDNQYLSLDLRVRIPIFVKY